MTIRLTSRQQWAEGTGPVSRLRGEQHAKGMPQAGAACLRLQCLWQPAQALNRLQGVVPSSSRHDPLQQCVLNSILSDLIDFNYRSFTLQGNKMLRDRK